MKGRQGGHEQRPQKKDFLVKPDGLGPGRDAKGANSINQLGSLIVSLPVFSNSETPPTETATFRRFPNESLEKVSFRQDFTHRSVSSETQQKPQPCSHTQSARAPPYSLSAPTCHSTFPTRRQQRTQKGLQNGSHV